LKGFILDFCTFLCPLLSGAFLVQQAQGKQISLYLEEKKNMWGGQCRWDLDVFQKVFMCKLLGEIIFFLELFLWKHVVILNREINLLLEHTETPFTGVWDLNILSKGSIKQFEFFEFIGFFKSHFNNFNVESDLKKNTIQRNVTFSYKIMNLFCQRELRNLRKDVEV